jgi:hypothetical protein
MKRGRVLSPEEDGDPNALREVMGMISIGRKMPLVGSSLKTGI